MSTLLVITSSYPLGGVTDPGFVEPEVEVLCKEFDRVIFAPVLDSGPQLPLPPNATLTRAFIGSVSMAARIKGIFSAEVWRHVWADRHHIKSLRHLRGAVATGIHALHSRDIILSLNLDPADTVVYNFWFTAPALGAAMIPGIKNVTRAHRFDLYYEREMYLSHSWRDEALRNIDAVYTVTDDGAEYLHRHHPDHVSKISVARLGSTRPLGLNPPADRFDHTLTFLSISRMAPVKRIPLMLSLIKEYARRHPNHTINWIHIGDGEEMARVREEASRNCPDNLHIDLRGLLSNKEVHSLLSSIHVDALLLTSESEGAPIVICEALSYGVPVIATDVGGVAELITPATGALLSPTPTNDEFESAILSVLPRLEEMRKAARSHWQQHLDSSSLRRHFAHTLRSLLDK